MCGLCGEIRFDGQRVEGEPLQRMMASMISRGPDQHGLHLNGPVGFGHRRLKILDLSDRAGQPMIDPESGHVLVFNGCIYNFEALRQELEAKGHRFLTSGDTEVILKAYREWGWQAVSRFLGMFAFALWDADTGEVVLARDRLGIKPLYLARSAGRLRFASTLPALLAAGGVDTRLDKQALHHYLTLHSVVPPPHTLLAGVSKLPPATVRIVQPDGAIRDHLYWSLRIGGEVEEREPSFEAWQERVLAALRLAVKRRLVADVPVGVLLSGGLDSSLIVALLAEAGQGRAGLETFSVGFEAVGAKEGDEFRYSDRVAAHFGTRHHRLPIATSEMLQALPRAIGAMSEPMTSHDNVGFFLLSREVSRHVKVVQSGQGADEVFAGYFWHPPMRESRTPLQDYIRLYFDRSHEEIAKVLQPDWVERDYTLERVENHFAGLTGCGPLDKVLHFDTAVILVDDPVKRLDNMTMAWGLEARVPFLDHELVELAGRIPARFKAGERGKWLLKEAARTLLPAEVIDRPKGYFPVPALEDLQGEVLLRVREVLTSERARQRELFRPSHVERLLAEPLAHHTPLKGSKLWQLALLEWWLQDKGV
ncbi:MAG: N-acetylglutaminylglutamine amidotransferase [Magnetococcales bacterium]|nr:N-acetylglutaminylglutamine amidotransferase [Magnetococcales bacterium]